MDDSYSFGAWVRQRRRVLDLTQAALARLIGVAAISIQKIEADERRPSQQVAELLAAQLHIPDQERERFLATARGERAPDQLPAPTQDLPERQVHLPTQLTSFLGRAREIGELRALLQKPDVRLVTLTGAGGTGKTRLALRVAEELTSLYPDGVWFVDLAPVSDSAQVAAACAQALGIPEVAGVDPQTRLPQWLRHRTLLLILDNYEQVIDAAPLVADLLVAAAQITIVVTSRVPLRLLGEQEYSLAPLGQPVVGMNSMEQITQYDAVTLFIARTQAVRPDFRITNANAPAVAEICARLDGLPLAIELAAARMRMFNPEQLLSRLMAAQLQTLTGGARNLPARQQTIRATIDWSYRLLEPPQQLLFARLGVCVGGWTLAAAEAIGSQVGVDVVQELEVLVQHSLVRMVETPTEPRYTMLETLREYALEQLHVRGEVATTQKQHAHYCTELAETAEPGLFSAKAPMLLALLRADLDNLRSALAWGISHEPNLAGQLQAALFEFWLCTPYPTEAIKWTERILTRSEAMSPAVQAKFKMIAGALIQGAQPNARVDAWYQESITRYRALGDVAGLATALTHYGSYFWLCAENQNSIPLLEEALELAQGLAIPRITAHALSWQGRNQLDENQFEQATHYWRRSFVLYEQIGYARGQAECLLGMACAAFATGGYERAWQLQGQRRLLDQSLGNITGVTAALHHMALIALALGRMNEAEELLREGLQLSTVEDLYHLHLWLCYVLARDGRAAEAQTEWRNAWLHETTNKNQPMSLALIACAAAISVACGNLVEGARLCCFVERHRQNLTYPHLLYPSPDEQFWFQPIRDQIHSRVDREQFESAQAAGWELTWEQATDEALVWLQEAQGLI